MIMLKQSIFVLFAENTNLKNVIPLICVLYVVDLSNRSLTLGELLEKMK